MKDAAYSVAESLLLLAVVGTVFGPGKWLGMWLDTCSVQATFARAGAHMTFRNKLSAFFSFQKRTTGW